MASRMVALLRGINVGGNKLVDMARLRDLMTDLGYTDVRTYLQSGNAVFSCPTRSAAGAAGQHREAASRASSDFSCRVITRRAAELDAAMSDDPLVHLLGDPSRHLVGFLSDRPRSDGVAHLAGEDFGEDQVRVVDRHLYLWCPRGDLALSLGQAQLRPDPRSRRHHAQLETPSPSWRPWRPGERLRAVRSTVPADGRSATGRRVPGRLALLPEGGHPLGRLRRRKDRFRQLGRPLEAFGPSHGRDLEDQALGRGERRRSAGQDLSDHGCPPRRRGRSRARRR